MKARLSQPIESILAKMGLGLSVLGLLIFLLWPRVHPANGHHRPLPCLNRLKQIGLALSNYEREMHSFPPAVIGNGSNQPIGSWRSLLIGHLEGSGFAGVYRHDLAWNAPENIACVRLMPDDLHCPEDVTAQPGETSYVAVTGPGFVFSGPKATRFDEIVDGTSNTIACVEMASSGITWTEPRDLTWPQLLARIKAKDLSRHKGGFHVLMADGGARFIPYGIDQRELHAMFTIAGNDNPNPRKSNQVDR